MSPSTSKPKPERKAAVAGRGFLTRLSQDQTSGEIGGELVQKAENSASGFFDQHAQK